MEIMININWRGISKPSILFFNGCKEVVKEIPISCKESQRLIKEGCASGS